MRLVFAIALLAGCGRYEFSDDPSELACQPTAMPIDGTQVSAMAATATPDGYAVFYTDLVGDVWGASYTVRGGIRQVANEVPIAVNATGPLGAITSGNTILVSAQYGRPAAYGTVLVPLDLTLRHLGEVDRDGQIAGSIPLATQLDRSAFITVTSTRQVYGQLVTPKGADTSGVTQIVDSSESTSGAAIWPSDTGYLATWANTSSSPDVARAALLDRDLGIVVGPAPVGLAGDTYDEISPRASWARDTNTYLFAWYNKASGGDQIWMSMRDSAFEEVVPAMQLGLGSHPFVVTNGSSFWIVWQDSSQTSHLSSVYVAADGTVTPRPIVGAGAQYSAWAMAERGNQPVLVWSESSDTAGMWIDPMCN